jgi:hypothetical protein
MNKVSGIKVNCRSILVAMLLTAGFSGFPQSVASEGTQTNSPQAISAIVQPALADVQAGISNLNISHWKAPSEVRSAAQQNAASIQRDLANTLPDLLSQADASPASVPPTFAVYRNIDALYDVLLRIHQTASLAAPQRESEPLSSALQKLEAARTQLGDTILKSSQDREAQIVKLQAAIKAAVPVQIAPPVKAAVIEDGPAAAPPVRKKKKAAPKPAPGTAPPAPSPHN